jgi:uncharacterized protein (DUF1501 family)
MSEPIQRSIALKVSRRGLLSRRGFLRLAGVGAGGLCMADALSAFAADIKRQGKSCILLWMAGGPSQFETFDPKPGADTQGPTKSIATRAAGIQIAEHWTRTAQIMNELAVIRSMTGKEGNHGRATYLLHTSYAPSGGIVHPGFGSTVAKELGDADFELPNFVAISGQSIGPSYLGVRYAPFVVTDPTRPPDNLTVPVASDRLNRRLGLLEEMEAPLARTGAAPLVREHQSLYRQTARMALSPRTRAFDLDREPDRVRDDYGRSAFGQGCLMARRLIEAGVAFVEVQSSGWDTHGNELPTLKKLIPPVDQGTAALIADLRSRGLLERTLVIWMGEFGRMPHINLSGGREHYPQAFNVALAGAGIKGGQLVGATDKRGAEVIERAVSVEDLFCTFCQALHLDPRKESQSNVGRPIKIVERGAAVKELF